MDLLTIVDIQRWRCIEGKNSERKKSRLKKKVQADLILFYYIMQRVTTVHGSYKTSFFKFF